MTRRWIEPWSPGPIANTQTIIPMGRIDKCVPKFFFLIVYILQNPRNKKEKKTKMSKAKHCKEENRFKNEYKKQKQIVEHKRSNWFKNGDTITCSYKKKRKEKKSLKNKHHKERKRINTVKRTFQEKLKTTNR